MLRDIAHKEEFEEERLRILAETVAENQRQQQAWEEEQAMLAEQQAAKEKAERMEQEKQRIRDEMARLEEQDLMRQGEDPALLDQLET